MTIIRRTPLKRSTKPIKRRKSLKKLWAALKRKKPLKRTRTKIKARAKFHAHREKSTKVYRRRFTDYQVMVRANICRQDRLRNRTRAEMAFAEMLDSMRVLYESEAIFLNGDRFILADFYFKAQKLVIELDGSAHDDQKEYGSGRDAWLLRVYKIRTIRVSNDLILRSPRDAEMVVCKALKLDIRLVEECLFGDQFLYTFLHGDEVNTFGRDMAIGPFHFCKVVIRFLGHPLPIIGRKICT